MASPNIETPTLPFDPARIRIEEPAKPGRRKLRFGQGACNACTSCNSFVGTQRICERCGHEWNIHSD